MPTDTGWVNRRVVDTLPVITFIQPNLSDYFLNRHVTEIYLSGLCIRKLASKDLKRVSGCVSEEYDSEDAGSNRTLSQQIGLRS